jgi:hypothetical protein
VPIDGKACRGEVQPEHDHLLGLGEDRLRNGEAERARSLLVDDQPEFGRLFDLPARRDAMMPAKLHRAGELTAKAMVAIVAAVLFGGHSYSPNSAS